ncbi:glycosyltransferase family 4 protein [Algoriphagus pacificus]|uniref:Glycosyltransferase family 4 protein n=1 Tax=Algoriphagus pacificus TaxID=2811234 RepID=A0ABS3CGX9_9BACT|nr:glycosyltransferase family 4 protein [Algoriphagus pacificus]MBN7816351.1 glycosyltransferase family 4 protein [Algoriphagus pacificus]
MNNISSYKSRNIRVIISTFGPLHLIKSAEFLSYFANVKVIQGWIPNRFNSFLLRIASKIVGRDLSISIKKRTPEILVGSNISIGIPEFYLWFNRLVIKVSKKNVALKAARMYGKFSTRFIKDAEIFHVRSGSGLNGAIEKAKISGMKVVVDHSIAHPAFLDKNLRNEYNNNNESFDLGLDSLFWQGVLADCEKADCLLVNSYFVKKTFLDQGFNPDKIKTVYLGVREDFFGIKKNYSVTEKLKILFTGNFGFRKGAEYLLRALVELDKRNFSYEMTVVGSFQDAASLVERYKPKNINFIGHIPQSELKYFLSNSDIYIFPSLAEGCASSGMEAMASGLPIIATLESGFPIINYENGILIPSKNSNLIVEKIMELASNENLRRKIGTNANITISSNFTWEKYASSVFTIYKELLNN